MRFTYDPNPMPSWPHHFFARVPPLPGQDPIDDVVRWCMAQCGPSFGATDDPTTAWDWTLQRPYYRFVFADDDDALAFRLRWC